MKHLNSITSFLMLALLLPATATAYDFEVDGIYYNITSSYTVEVTYKDVINPSYQDTIVIPSLVGYNTVSYIVTAIGDSAFHGSAIKDVTIPETVTSIGREAFTGIEHMLKVTCLPSTPPAMEGAFDKHDHEFPFALFYPEESHRFPTQLVLFVSTAAYHNYKCVNEYNGYFSWIFCYDGEKTAAPSCTVNYERSLDRYTAVQMTFTPNEESIIYHHIDYDWGSSNWYYYWEEGNTAQVGTPEVSCVKRCIHDISGFAVAEGKLPSDLVRLYDNEDENFGHYLMSPYQSMVGDGLDGFYSSGIYYINTGQEVDPTNIGHHDLIVSGGFYKDFCDDYQEWHRSAYYSGDIIIPSTVNDCTVAGIGFEAFAHCHGITSITLPDSNIYLSFYAFNDTHLKKLIMPISLTTVTGIDDCTVDSLYLIGNGPWQGSYFPNGVKALSIGKGVTSLYGMEVNPEVIYCYATAPPICNNDSIFEGNEYCYSRSFTGYDAELHVPASSIAAYQIAPIWCNFTNIIGDAVPLEDITINQDSIEVIVGRQAELTTTLSPTYAMPNSVSWNSNDKSIATIENGVITAIKKGECDVFAFCQGKYDVCHVVVNEILPTAVTLNQESAIIEPGSQMTLTATILPEDASYKKVSWWSSNKAVATVSDNGIVTAVATGECEITAWCRGMKAICHVLVTEALSNYDNYLSVNDAETYQGKTIVIPVKMTNNQNISSFQTDVYLPDGLELMKEDGEYLIEPSDRMTRTHSIMCDDLANDAIRVLCYSSNSKPFTGNSGDDLFYLTVKAADNASGDYFIQLKNTLLTTSDFTELTAPDVAAIVRVNDYMPGDANGNGTITVTDAVITAFYVLERNPVPFFFNAADVNKDGNITVTDVTRIAWMVLNPTLAAPRRAPALWSNSDRLSSEAITLAAGETRRVSILLDNEMDYNGFQLDLRLPAGLTASNFSLTDRANSHAFEVNTLQSGDIRALCYSPAMAAINGHEGTLLTFDVTATGSVKGDITVDGIELVTTDCQTVKLDAFTIGVNTTTAINELIPSKSIARIEYFNLAGQQIDRPTIGVTLVITTYTDGTRSTAKLLQ